MSVSLTAFSVLLLSAGPWADAQEAVPLQVISDEIFPARFLPGEVAKRRSVAVVPEGASMAWPERLSIGPRAEASGSVHVRRDPVDEGRVRWTVTYPFTSWSAGLHELGPMTVRASIDGRTFTTELGALVYAVDDPLPSDGEAAVPAPAKPPLGRSRTPWRVIPLVPAALLLLSGATWWRSTRSAPREGRVEPETSDPLRDIRNSLSGLQSDPGETLRRVAGLVRDIPALRAMGVTDASTTSDVIRAVSNHGADGIARVIGPLLWSADAQRFGRIEPSASDVDAWVRALLEAVDHD